MAANSTSGQQSVFGDDISDLSTSNRARAAQPNDAVPPIARLATVASPPAVPLSPRLSVDGPRLSGGSKGRQQLPAGVKVWERSQSAVELDSPQPRYTSTVECGPGSEHGNKGKVGAISLCKVFTGSSHQIDVYCVSYVTREILKPRLISTYW